MVRILLYTGKGGVGKTSVAAASALLCAERGYRTIVLSTDIAHSLADAFDVQLGPEPARDRPEPRGPGAGRLLQHRPLLADDPELRRRALRLARPRRGHGRGDDASCRAWTSSATCSGSPTTSTQGKYDVIVVDAAPTGETLRLLSLPGRQPLVGRAHRADRPAGHAARAARCSQRVLGVPMPARGGLRRPPSACSIASTDVHRLLADPDRTSVRVRSRSTSCRSPRPSARSRTSTCSATRATWWSRTGCCRANAGAFFEQLARGPAALPADRRAGIRAGAGPNRAAVRSRDGRRRSAARDRRGAVRRRRPDRGPLSRRALPGQPRGWGYVLQVELPFTHKGELR